jgi:hypothetical protein
MSCLRATPDPVKRRVASCYKVHFIDACAILRAADKTAVPHFFARQPDAKKMERTE